MDEFRYSSYIINLYKTTLKYENNNTYPKHWSDALTLPPRMNQPEVIFKL